MLGNDDLEVLIDEPVTAADLFGEDEEEAPIIPPLSPDPNLDENAPPAAADGTAAEPAPRKKKQVNRLPNLNEKWITDPNKEGMYAVNKYFKDIKLKRGKGNELSNIKSIMRRYEYWAQQCYPKLIFSDFVDKVENLSAKKLVKNTLQEIRCNRNTGGTIDDIVADEDGANRLPDDGNPFTDTTQPITSPSSQAFTSFSSPQPTANTDSPVTDELREIIRRKREEAIAKRKRKLEESMNQSNISQMNDDPDVSIGGEKINDTSTLDSSYVSVSDANENERTVSQSEMEVSDGDDMKEIIRKKREEAIAKRKRKLEDSVNGANLSVVSSNYACDTDKYKSSQENNEQQITSDNSQSSYMSVSQSNEENAHKIRHDSHSSMTISETSEGRPDSGDLRHESSMSVSEIDETLRNSPVPSDLDSVSESNKESFLTSSVKGSFDHESKSSVDEIEGSCDSYENSLNYSVSPSRTNGASDTTIGEENSVANETVDMETASSIEKEKMEIDEQIRTE